MTLPIVERLRQKEPSGSKFIAGTAIMNRRNFDGDEAADTIEELVEALREARHKIDESLDVYDRDVASMMLADASHSICVALVKIGGES